MIGSGVKHRHWLLIANCAVLVGVILSLWVPLWWRHRVTVAVVKATEVEKSRWIPDQATVDVLWELVGNFHLSRSRGTIITQEADEILGGWLRLGGRPPVRLEEVGWRVNPFRDSTWHFHLQQLPHVRILLYAWKVTQRQEYLVKASEVVLSWIKFSRRQPFGGGYIWNDHVMSDRAVTLSLFWTAFARSGIYDAVVGAMVVRSLAKHIGFLKDARHFNFLTNHGVMQNLALLHVAGTFPLLANKTGIIEVAARRITLQHQLLVTPEGVWMEHSPGYQLFAVGLLRRASRYLQIFGQPVPENWADTLARMENVLVQFARPDGSLPPLGDTVEMPQNGHRWPSELVGAIKSGKRLEQFFAVCGGYAVFWDQGHSDGVRAKGQQVVMTVSNFPGHGHKHADELSVLMYYGGKSWLTGPGYWPYGTPGRSYAVSWSGSNAPTFQDEPSRADRTAELTGYARAAWGDFLEMRRSGPNGFQARREVLWIRPNWLIVVDQVQAPTGFMPIVRWLFPPDVDSRTERDGSWVLTSLRGHSRFRLRMQVVSDVPVRLTVTRGNEQPFRGWVYTGKQALPSPQLEIRPQAEQAFVVTSFQFEPARSEKDRSIRLVITGSGQRWSLMFRGEGDSFFRVDRYPSAVSLSSHVSGSDGAVAIQTLSCPAKFKHAYVSLRNALANEYGGANRHGSVSFTRYLEVTLFVIAVWILQEVFLVVIRRWEPRLVGPIRILSCLVLLALAIFLSVYWAGMKVV